VSKRHLIYLIGSLVILAFVPGWTYFLPQIYVEKKVVEAIKEDFFLRTGLQMTTALEVDLALKRYSPLSAFGDPSWQGSYNYIYSEEKFRAFVFISSSFCIDIRTNNLGNLDQMIMPSKPHMHCFR